MTTDFYLFPLGTFANYFCFLNDGKDFFFFFRYVNSFENTNNLVFAFLIKEVKPLALTVTVSSLENGHKAGWLS